MMSNPITIEIFFIFSPPIGYLPSSLVAGMDRDECAMNFQFNCMKKVRWFIDVVVMKEGLLL